MQLTICSGNIMAEFQAAFDQYLIPACECLLSWQELLTLVLGPSQLTAPVLHKTIAHSSLQPLIYAGKGMK